MRKLSILAAGKVSLEDFAALSPFFDSVELLDLMISASDPLDARKTEINRAVDGASSPWILILRERETVDAALARELSDASGEAPAAWGFRVRSVRFYCGEPLRLGRDDGGEIRFLHRRHCRFDPKSEVREMKVEGPVLRLRTPLRVTTFASPEEHRAFLDETAIPHSSLRQVLLFAQRAISSGAWRGHLAALRFLWIEAGYDHEGRSADRPFVAGE